jgi:hypothetical protein
LFAGVDEAAERCGNMRRHATDIGSRHGTVGTNNLDGSLSTRLLLSYNAQVHHASQRFEEARLALRALLLTDNGMTTKTSYRRPGS